jgi:proteasome lid subunit RPN8/RPN11
LRITQELVDQMIDHARQDTPDECCGVVLARDGEAVEVRAYENVYHSPLKFGIDGLALLKLNDEIDEKGLDIGAIYHSHTRTAPYPSQTDINFAAGWPGVEWIIVGLDRAGEATVRTYLIEDGHVREL